LRPQDAEPEVLLAKSTDWPAVGSSVIWACVSVSMEDVMKGVVVGTEEREERVPDPRVDAP
jgi:hypothetical protein